ncbi:DUF1007 family protein [Rubrivivax sp. RP6-9]|uniref:DUF1007 family protein n=1 Tax=Rubrivivax sp. RP6-9 TaxID=3415750 RepID=UPI003CC6C195
MRRGATATAAALLLAAGGAAAHPHGRLACQVQLGIEGGRLVWVAQRLTLDAASSAALAERLQVGAAEPLPKAVLQFRSLLLGLFRHSGWMLDLRAAGAEAAVALDDRAATWRQRDDGRLELSLTLAPTAPVAAPPGTPWALACRDPVWYWVGEFAGDVAGPAVSATGATCAVQLDGPRDAAAEAAALTAAARAAGALGAEQVAASATATPQLGAGRAELLC